MRVGLKLILIFLLALRAMPTAAASSVLRTDFVHNSQQKEKLQKHEDNHACLLQEQESVQAALHFRWPLLVPYLSATGFSLDDPQIALKVNDDGAGTVLINAFYRSLLFPAHFFQ